METNALETLSRRPADVILTGRYRIDRELGRGGFGIVFLASDLHLHGRSVVVKAPVTIDPHAHQTQRKFKAEIEALARIQHPGVVSVLDTGFTPSGRPFFVMEYVSGVPLSDWLTGRELTLDLAAEIIGQCAAALAAVHAHEICHRDLKPQNILVSETGVRPHIKLIDFGIASLGHQTPSQSTQVAGTLFYMAPEQLFGNVSPQSDIYSLGVIAYQLLTGAVPFPVDTPTELHRLQREHHYPNPCTLRPALPPTAGRVIDKALAFDPADRFTSATEFARLLTEALAEKKPPVPDPAQPQPPRRTTVKLRVTTMNPVARRILRWLSA